MRVMVSEPAASGQACGSSVYSENGSSYQNSASTRRFSERPLAELFDATGYLLPLPLLLTAELGSDNLSCTSSIT